MEVFKRILWDFSFLEPVWNSRREESLSPILMYSQQVELTWLRYLMAVFFSPQVSFPDCVRWTTIEFDPQCGTAQPEDALRLLIPSRTLHLSNLGGKPLIHDTINTWTELKKFSGSTGWPTTVLVLPGKKCS